MSLYLGKIHYWLFNKIRWFEGLEENIIKWMEEKGTFAIEQWKEEIFDKYGRPTENKPLEDIIDSSNIHGWLQDKISRAEGRQSAWITRIVNSSPGSMEELVDIFEKQGTKLGSEYAEKSLVSSPEDVYNMLNDYILEGMPCDRVNELIENNEEVYSWATTTCLHTPYWKEENGEVNNFYTLREAWVKSFVKALNSPYNYFVSLKDGVRVHQIKK